MMIRIFLSLIIALSAYSAQKSQDIEIPRTAYKDIYKYYLLEAGKQATVNYVVLRRQSFDTILYIKAEINCPSRYFRQIGYNARSPRDIPANSLTEWYKPTIGTIESDIVTYVCR